MSWLNWMTKWLLLGNIRLFAAKSSIEGLLCAVDGSPKKWYGVSRFQRAYGLQEEHVDYRRRTHHQLWGSPQHWSSINRFAMVVGGHSAVILTANIVTSQSKVLARELVAHTIRGGGRPLHEFNNGLQYNNNLIHHLPTRCLTSLRRPTGICFSPTT